MSGKPKLNDHQKGVDVITFDEINDYDLTPISKKVLYIIKEVINYLSKERVKQLNSIKTVGNKVRKTSQSIADSQEELKAYD